MRLDKYSDVYQRSVYSFLMFMSDLGGVQTCTFIIGSYLVAIFSKRLFNSALMRNIYHLDYGKLKNPKNPDYELPDDENVLHGGFKNTLRNNFRRAFLFKRGISKFLDAAMADSDDVNKE